MSREQQTDVPEPEVIVRGAVTDEQVARAVDKLRSAYAIAPPPVLFVRLKIAIEPNPALERPAVATATVDVNGDLVRAHVAAPTVDEAIDRLVERIRRRIERLVERRRDRSRQAGGRGGEGEPPPPRPSYVHRPVEERELVRTKAPAIRRLTPQEALFQMDQLDHDFHLFVDADTGADCVVLRDEGGEPALVSADPAAGRGPADEPGELPVVAAPRLALDDALSALDADAVNVVPFVDRERGRMRVAYRRYDGHYGLVEPAEAA